jgi:hypothetical protein
MDHLFNQLAKDLAQSANRRSLLLLGWLLLATPGAVQGQFLYGVTNGTVTIRGYTGTNAVVVIPNTITGLPVTAIGDSAFYGCTSLTSVTIPNSVADIGDSPAQRPVQAGAQKANSYQFNDAACRVSISAAGGEKPFQVRRRVGTFKQVICIGHVGEVAQVSPFGVFNPVAHGVRAVAEGI